MVRLYSYFIVFQLIFSTNSHTFVLLFVLFFFHNSDVTNNLRGVYVDSSGGPAVLENCLVALNDKQGIFAMSETTILPKNSRGIQKIQKIPRFILLEMILTFKKIGKSRRRKGK